MKRGGGPEAARRLGARPRLYGVEGCLPVSVDGARGRSQ